MFSRFVREGEAPAEPLIANGSPGGSPSHALAKTSKDSIKLTYPIKFSMFIIPT